MTTISAVGRIPLGIGRLLTGLVALVISTAASAAIWESPLWVLDGRASALVGYSSNLSHRAGGESGWVLSGQPELELYRRGSVTQLAIIGGVIGNTYFDVDVRDSLDPYLRVDFSHPESALMLARYEGEVGWRRHTEANLDEGARIRQSEFRTDWEGIFYDTGKTVFGGRLGYRQVDFDRFNGKLDRFNVGFLVGYEPHALLRYAAGYEFTTQSYRTDDVGRLSGDRDAHRIVFRVRGELTPKITARLGAGIEFADFSAGTVGSGEDWFTVGELSWSPAERRRVTLQAERDTTFSTRGETVVRNNLGIRYFHGMAAGFSAEVFGSVGTAKYSTPTFRRDDDTYRLGATLNYGLTGRLMASVGADWLSNDSTSAVNDFQRTNVFARAGWDF